MVVEGVFLTQEPPLASTPLGGGGFRGVGAPAGAVHVEGRGGSAGPPLPPTSSGACSRPAPHVQREVHDLLTFLTTSGGGGRGSLVRGEGRGF